MDPEKLNDGRDTAPAGGETRVERTEPQREENPNRHPRDEAAGKEKGKDVRSLVRAAIREHKDPDEPRNERAPGTRDLKPQDRAASTPSPQAQTVSSKPDASATVPPAEPQAPASVAAPAALSKDVKAIWDTLPDQVKAEFVKREQDTQKGVEQLKAKFKPIEDAFTPVKDQLQRLGKTEAEAVSQLLGWHAALAGPNKAQAFKALAQAHGFDLSTLGPQPGVAPQTPADPNQILRPYLDPLNQKVTALETELQRRDRERVQNDISNFSKDKPHFEKVRTVMGHLINSKIATGATPKEVFDDAYERACRADPETFALIQQEQREKQEAETRAAQEAAAKKAADEAERRRKADAEEVQKARRAGVGPRAGSPVGGRAVAGTPQGQSVRDSLKSAIKEQSAII
ncbi:MAG: hypothetical protein WDN46_14270 [Methylocella sp.]